MRAIDVLKFAIEWNEKSEAAGGKTWKGKYRDAAFEKECAAEIASLEARFVGSLLRAKRSTLKKKFTNKHEKIVTARNHLLRLYMMVSLRFFL